MPYNTMSGRSDGVVSFDVWRSDPSLSTLQHIASSDTLPNRGSNMPSPSRSTDTVNGSAPVFRVNPAAAAASQAPPPTHADNSTITRPRYSSTMRISETNPSSASHFRSSSEEVSDEGDDKKHICTTCHKRFNRPSSLRIHMNTHTGATPFRCPYPNCGREFNVNSNMRRHYRNHSNPATGKDDPSSSSSNSSAPRRRQRRVEPSSHSNSPRDDRDFLVLRPNTNPHSAESVAAARSSTNSSSWPSTAYGKIPPNLSGDSDVETESTIDDEDELMDDDTSSYHSRNLSPAPHDSLYRLQPVSDFGDRYSARYHPQSDVRSLPPPPPTPLLSASSTSSSSSSPPASPMSSYNSPTTTTTSWSGSSSGTKFDPLMRLSQPSRWS
uniref:C2H2-type domain-containing protein n=1 Tax=Moniliophthora roreri TaxID=221103 RepID=A0A0W0G978_MONRR